MKNLRKYIIYCALFLVSFLNITNVNAADNIIFLDYYNMNNEYIEYMSDIKETIDLNNTYNLKYLIIYNYNNNNNPLIYVEFFKKYENMQDINVTGIFYSLAYYRYDSSNPHAISSNIGYISENADLNVNRTAIIGNTLYLSDVNNIDTFKQTLINILRTEYQNGGNSNSTSKNTSIRQSEIFNFPYYYENSFIYYTNLPVYYTKNLAGNAASRSIQDICSNLTNQYYSNTLYQYSFVYNSEIASTMLSCGDQIPTYYDALSTQVIPNISVSEQNYRYTEEDNNFIYNKKISISIKDDFINDEYVVTYSYIDDLLFDVSSGTITDSNYQFDVPVNGTLTVFIKDLQGNIIDSFEKTYSDMGSLNVRAAFDSNGNGENLYSLNVRYNFGNMQSYDVMPFRIMYFSNDFSEENTPRLLGVKKYYYDTNNSKKDVANDFESLDIKNLKCNKYNTQIICSGYIINSLSFTNIEFDFLFNHIENYSIYYSDPFTQNFSARNIDVLSNDLIGYTKYKFPNNSDRAYIYKKHVDQNVKTGSVVFPWYYTENETINIRANYYKSNGFLTVFPFQNNAYYNKFDFDLTDNEVLTILVNRINTCNTILNIKLPLNNIICNFDSAYIFVPNDFIVSFNAYNGTDSYQVLTDDDSNKIIIDKEYNYKDFYDSYNMNSLFDELTDYLNGIKSYTNVFTDLFGYLYNSQNNEIKSFLLASFILVVVCGVIILARRR